ncbi:unnamed protein product [Closterium sp. NIES-53]
MNSLRRSGGSGDGSGGSSGSGGGRISSRCGAVRWGVSSGGQMQLQRRPRESLPPQQLREWYASKSGGVGSSGSRCAGVQLGVSGGGLAQLQRRPRETLTPQELREWYAQHGASRSSARCPYVIRTGIEAAALGASEPALSGTTPADALHTFTLDSGASRCFFCDSTTLTPLSAPVPVRLADPLGGPVLARSSTVLPCPVVSSGSLLGLHLPSFSTNLHHRLGHPSLPRLRGMHSRLLVSGLPRSLPPLPPLPAPPCLPCVEGRQRAAPHSSSFPPTTAPLLTLHMGVWDPARVSGQGHERYFLLVVDDYTRYTTVFPLRSKDEVVDVLIPWNRAVRLQLRERFSEDLLLLRLHYDRVTAGAGGTGGTAAAGPGGARTRGTGAAGTAGGSSAGGAGAGGAGARGTGAGGAGAGGAGAVDPGAGGARGNVRPRTYLVPLLQQVLGVSSSSGLTPPLLCPPPDQSQPPLQPASPLPAPSPYTDQNGGLTEHHEPASRPASPRLPRRVPHSRPPPVPGTHTMVLRPSSVPLRVPLPPPPESSLPAVPDPESDLVRAASPTVSCLLASVVTAPFKSTAASALVAEHLDFAAAYRLDYATALVAESESASPLSVGGECALGTDVLEDRQEEFECLAAAVPRFASMLLAPEGDPDAPDIPTARSYAEAITGPYSSLWKAAMDAEMASWKSTSTYVDAVPPPGVNIVDGMWIFRVKRPPGSPPAFKARYVARCFNQRQGIDYFQTFSPTLKMTPLRGSLHEEMWLHRPPGLTGSFPAGTQWSLRRPVYGLRQAPREWQETVRTTLAAMGFTLCTADPSLFLRTDTLLPPFYILVYVEDLVTATADTEELILMKSELKKRHTCTDLGELRSYLGLQITRDRAGCTIRLTQSHMVHKVLQRFGFQFSLPQPTPLSTSHSLSAPPSDESIEPSGPYPELVGCLIMLDMGLVLGGRGRVVLTGHTDASWVDDSATQQSSQGYTFSLGSGSISWQSTRSSFVLSSSCEAEIYARAMAAQELRLLTYVLTDLGEQPRSPPFLYVENKAQRGQLRLAYVATMANTADIFTKALPPGDHQRFSTVLGLRRIGLVMEVACTSMIHAAAPHFLWPFAVQYATHQLNHWPHISLPETSPTLRWTGEVGDASVFRVWGSRAFVRDTSANKLSAYTIPYVFLGIPPDAPGWQFYHPTSRCVIPFEDVTFDESVPFYRPLLRTAPVEVAVGSGFARGAASGGAAFGGADPKGVESEGAGSGVVEPAGVEPGGAEPEGVEPGGAECEGAESGGAELRGTASSGGPTGAAAAGHGGARIRGNGAAENGGVGGAGAGDPAEPGAAGAGGVAAGGTCAGGTGAGGAGVGGAGAVDPGARGAGAGGAVSSGTSAGRTVRPRPYLVPLLQQTSRLTEHREPASRPASPVRTARRVPHSRPPHVPSTHAMALRPSSVPLRVPLPPPPEFSLPAVPDPESDLVRAASPTVSCLLASVVTAPSFESTVASALVAELLDFAAAYRLDYATALVAESDSASPLSVGGESALGTDVLEHRQEEFECLAAAVPRFTSMLLAPEGDPDAPDIPTPCSYAEAITGFSLRQGVDYFQTFSPTAKMTTLRVLLHFAAQRDYELHYLDFSTAFLQGSLQEEIWLRRPPGFTGSFPAGTQWSLRRKVYGLCQAPRKWHDTLRTTLAALGFTPCTADPSFLRTDMLLPPFYVLIYVDDLVFATADTEALTLVKSELQERHTHTNLSELRSYLGLQITWDRAQRTIILTQSHMVHYVLQRFGFQFSSPLPTPLPTSHSLSAPPSDESVEPSGPYPELVGCLMYLMTCTQPDLAYPLSLLARYVTPGRHRKVHWDAAKRVLRYLCSTLGMGLVLGGRGPVVLTGHADASWVDESATQRSSKGYTFSLGSGSISWQSTRSSSVLSSSCEAEIYAGAMAAQELHWLTHLLTDLGEQPRLPPVLYVDNKAMIALCQEHRLEHRTKHIALRYFLARELQQRGQLCLAYVASMSNTADIFTKALPLSDHQRFSTVLGLGILQSFTLPASLQQNRIAERHIGLVMEVACTSMIHAAAPHFLWPFAVCYAAHQLNLWPRVSLPETSPTLCWIGEVGDALVFRFYHPTSRRVILFQDVTFDDSVPFYHLFPYRSAPPPPLPLFLAPGPPPVDPLPPQGPAPLGVSQVGPLLGIAPVVVAVGLGVARGAASGGAASGSAEPKGVESEGAGSGGVVPAGVEPWGAEPEGVEPEGAESEGAESGGAERRGTSSSGGPAGTSPRLSPRLEPLSPQQLLKWFAQSTRLRSGAAGAGDSAAGDTGAGGAGVTAGAGGTGGAVAAGHGGARIKGNRAAETGGVGGAGAGDPTEPGAAGAGGVAAGGTGAGGAGAGGAGVGGAGGVDPGARGAGAGGAVSGGTSAGCTVRPRPYLPASPLLAPSPNTEQTGGLTEHREPASRPASPGCTARCVPRSCPPPVPSTHTVALRPSSVPLRVPLPPPPESSLPAVPDPESDLVRAASPTVSCLLASIVNAPSFESTVVSALVAELLDFAAAYRLDYATALVAESESASPLSVGGECALGTDVLEDRQEDFECLACAVPRFASMLLAPEGDPDAPNIPTPRSYAEAIMGPYFSQWQATMDAKMASLTSTSTNADAIPPSRANIVDGMWIFRVKRSSGSSHAFKARYIARGFSQRQGVDYFQTFSPTPKMTTLRVLLHIATQRDYELHSLDFSTAFLQGSLHKEIRLCRPPGFTGSFLAAYQWSLRWPVYGLCQAPHEWHDTLRTILAALGFTPSSADPSMFLRTDMSLPPFYVLFEENEE